jgi:hypothetical protein
MSGGGGAIHIRESGGRTSIYGFTLYILKYRARRLQQIKGRVSREMLRACITRDKGAWRNMYPFGNEIKSKECSESFYSIHVQVKGMFNEILDLFTKLGHDQMDYSYCYFVTYMYIYDLTTNFLFIFSGVLCMLLN